VVFVHALRNSLIPISVGIGGEIGPVAGSFDRAHLQHPRDGCWLPSLLDRDYPVLMGIRSSAFCSSWSATSSRHRAGGGGSAREVPVTWPS
jgi:hypothetical protein